MKVSDHFNSTEFRCRCGECEFSKEFVPHELLLIILEDVRTSFDVPVTITSCKRCESHNKAVGGVKDSQHVKGTAADIQVAEWAPSAVYDFIDERYGDKVSLGKYNSFVHVDVRMPGGARWK